MLVKNRPRQRRCADVKAVIRDPLQKRVLAHQFMPRSRPGWGTGESATVSSKVIQSSPLATLSTSGSLVCEVLYRGCRNSYQTPALMDFADFDVAEISGAESQLAPASSTISPLFLRDRFAASRIRTTRQPACPSLIGRLRLEMQSTK